MPTYAFKNTKTGKRHEEFMSMTELDEYLAANPHIEQLPNGFPGIIRGRPQKPNDGFRDVLREIKKKHSQGFTSSNINTF